MKAKDQKGIRETGHENESPDTQLNYKETKAIIDYLFKELPGDDRSTDNPIESLSKEEENSLAKMVHFFLQANYDKSITEAKRCMESKHPEIRSFALLAHAVNNVAQNNILAARDDFLVLQQEAKRPKNERIAALNDIYRFILSVFFHLGDELIPIPMGAFAHCSEGTRLFALYGQSYSLYLQQDYAQALGVAEAALAMSADRHPLICIYLYLSASMAAISLSRFEQADRLFLKALELARPESYIQPFIGHHGPLQGLVEKHMRDREPQLYKLIAEKVIHFRTGWTEIHNPRSSNKVTNELTPYEFAVAMLATKGKTNQEIADYLHISINTVKAHLSTIFQKVGVSKRSELKEFLNK